MTKAARVCGEHLSKIEFVTDIFPTIGKTVRIISSGVGQGKFGVVVELNQARTRVTVELYSGLVVWRHPNNVKVYSDRRDYFYVWRDVHGKFLSSGDYVEVIAYNHIEFATRVRVLELLPERAFVQKSDGSTFFVRHSDLEILSEQV